MLETKPSFQLNSDATYVISGGLGGVGRATARWMVTYGARNLILLSRFGPRTESATECIKDLRAQKVRVETPACDITDYKTTQEVFARLSPIMPPIKGCIQGSVIAKVSGDFLCFYPIPNERSLADIDLLGWSF